ncbi:MAG: NAD(P)H-dependent oxidoreductase [Clostridia bacterium]|nr:NAD(P)H-dependent oxidoreductase [Clostridia bacterium]
MKITVINGTEKQGVTCRLKENFLESFKPYAEITEFYLPKDCPAFCIGCTSCFKRGEATCKDSAHVSAIEQSLLCADLIVVASPSYVMHVTGALKSLFDHLAYRWMPHRPATQMFGKRAVVITQCLGAGAKSTAKDIAHSLSWWGISHIDVASYSLMEDIVWDSISEKRRKKMLNRTTRLARKYAKINYSRPAKTSLATKVKFNMCRFIQKRIQKSGVESIDCQYWQFNGWLDSNRPWKKQR